ncbi:MULTISPECIES: Nif3-like dinuclear metal center hexameric protein [Subtercola]|uniref:GTP cyclohydrolase 1 type 2 homolog n=1 Tax=Subtercola vilae TaxID=2056433 RepID=A0A4T2C8X3_9MICO|nr:MULTISPECIES: Nif3-like dinuclear metal center hexameric protein [Subtercola]MEA9984844.1 Nif3-like dinuclear metal center hexameric protein [Subtercola sp. RTI3]TIH39871.1 Nif3-like dinuclear metal center hexameric protein [Subtercola vilae]
MSVTVREVNEVIERLWPVENAEQWDSPGLVTGSLAAEVTSIHLAVDAVSDTVNEAIALGAGLLLVHHPLLLRGVTTVAENTYKGAMLARLIRAGCALVAAHTNADIVENGVSAVIASRLGLENVVPLTPSAVPGTGIGRAGDLPAPVTLGRLALILAEVLPATATGIRVAGHYDTPVSRVALCGGAGDSLLGEPEVRGADVYITSDLRHHPASEAREQAELGNGPALIDVSHWASEWLWLEVAAAELRHALPGVSVTVSDLRTDPWDFVVTQ